LDKSISARRKAQQLARNGDLAGAVEELERILQAGEGDPYDFVFRGDLLARLLRFDEAVFAYEEAISAYERVGLYRNAIAICKKVLRTDPGRKRTHGRLGDLYSKEGLASDAVSHFLAYLDSAGAEATGEEFLETLERVADMAGQKPEVTLRVADLFVRVGREERASQMLLEIAEQTASHGAHEIAEELRARARAILPPPPGETPVPTTSEAQVEIAAFPVFETSSIESTSIRSASVGPTVIEPTSMGHVETRSIPSPAHGNGHESAAAEGEPSGNGFSPPDATEPGPIVIEIPDLEAEEPEADGFITISPEDAAATFDLSADPIPEFEIAPVAAQAQDEVAEDGFAAPQPSTLTEEGFENARERLERAIAEKDWVHARDIATSIHDEDPENLFALEKLVVVSRELGDTLAIVRFLVLLGDLKINEEELEASLDCFLKVMELDPENVTARRRLARFRDMNVPGSERITEECRNSIQALLETDGAKVSIKSQGGVETEEWFDLSALLQEFRDGAASQIDPNDAEGHYDLALSHHEMGLFEEAIEEFGIILGSKELSPDMELKARELRGECLERLERHREAIHEYRLALDVEELPESKRTPLRYRLACALEMVGECDEARSIFQSLSSGRTPFLDTRAHLERLGG
jgi:tetratricopeptide (TPR) repeat protein